MPAGLFYENAKITLGKDLVADTTNETTSAVADMAGFDEVTFLAKFGDVDTAAVATFAVKENTANSVSSPSPTGVTLSLGSTNTVTGVITSGALVLTESSGNLDDKIVAITVKKSALSKRYCFLSVTVSAESYEMDFIGIIQSCPRTLPVSQSSDVVATAYGYG